MKTKFGKQNRQKLSMSLPNHGGVRKVGLLIVMLVLVLYGMYEAGKPENWAWMGFENSTQDNQPKEIDSSESPELEQQDEADQESELTIQVPADSSKSNQTDENDDGWDNFDLASASRKEFWRQVFRRLNRQSRLDFYELVQAVNRDEMPTEQAITVNQKLFSKIEKLRTGYHARMLEAMISASDQRPGQQQSYSEILLELQQSWEYDILPSFKSVFEKRELSEENRQVIEWLSSTLKAIALDQIKDGTPSIRDMELPAWSEAIRKLQDTSQESLKSQSLGKIDMNQLMGQTSFYRGKVVSIEGQMLRAQKINLSQPIAGQNDIFELWIAPKKQRSVFPYCVYALEMPENYNTIDYGLSSVSVPVEIEGLVFKKRFYTAADGTGTECPLILTRVPTVFYEADSGAQTWSLQGGAFWSVTAICLLGALFIAYLVYRASRQRRGVTSHEHSRIETSLESLKQDPKVESIADRLKRFSE